LVLPYSQTVSLWMVCGCHQQLRSQCLPHALPKRRSELAALQQASLKISGICSMIRLRDSILGFSAAKQYRGLCLEPPSVLLGRHAFPIISVSPARGPVVLADLDSLISWLC
jgi:hypothetical protein